LRPAATTPLGYEVANALHRYVAQGAILADEAAAELDVVLELGIIWFGDAEPHRQALRVPQEQRLPAVHDAHYLALAERLGAERWTSDWRLAQAVGAARPRVRLVE
jgi:predicted nucleic acid-binding protein